MNELMIEQKAKAYDKALEAARCIYNNMKEGGNFSGMEDLEVIFPELKESEDELTWLINYIEEEAYYLSMDIRDNEDRIKLQKLQKSLAWLEKQCSEPNWCHHNVDLSNCSEEYRKAYYDGWNNCNMQYSQCRSELDDVVKCLINGMKFYYEDNKEATWGTDKWSMPVKHIIEVLEKQGEQKLELKESEDNEIRKSIIGFLITISSLKDGMTLSNEDFDSKVILEWAAWLEKQGERGSLYGVKRMREY